MPMNFYLRINNTYFAAMEKISLLTCKKIALIIGVILALTQTSSAQSEYLPLSYQFGQKFNSALYSTHNALHTSLKPFLIDSALRPEYNTLMLRGVDSSRKSWIPRKLFNDHFIDVKGKGYTFYADYLPDLQVGRDFNGKKTTNINTRGYQFGGSIGTKFTFYTSGFENSAVFPAYYDNLVNKFDFVPGQAYDRNSGLLHAKDYSYSTAYISYTPVKQLNFTLGEDKTFIGDGYRSLLLSDYAANYPLLRVTANLGKVQYMMMWAYLEEHRIVPFDNFGSNRRKWAAFHYLDWNISNRVSLGFFNALIAQEADDNGVRHSFDVNYINPILFSKSLGPSSQPDNVLVGFTGKYKVFDKSAIYGQLLLDRFNAGDFFSGKTTTNTNGVQLGIRGADILAVKDLNYLFEFNTVKPYTYTSGQVITNYTHYTQPLGDPLGANFREFIGIINYSIGRFDLMGQVNYAKYGLDAAGTNFGKDVTLPFTAASAPTSVGQGITTNLYYAEGTVSFLINPKYNLRLEAGALYRDESNTLGAKKTTMLTFGLRSTFRNLYHDF